MSAICVDAGTSLIKAVGYDERGRAVAVAREAIPVCRPAAGWAEQDMSAVWQGVVSTVVNVVRRLDSVIEFIAVTAQGDGVWLVDPTGTPTGPAVLWNDARAVDIVDGWIRAGIAEEAFRLNGSLPFPGLASAILTWLHRHDPQRLHRSVAALTCGGWIFSQLTGERAVDSSDASAPFMDIHRREYSTDLLRLLDMEWARDLLPELRADDSRGGELTAQSAAQLGLPAETRVVMAPYDIASTAIGSGAIRAGQACGILGTTLCTEVVTDEVSLGEAAVGFTIALGLPGRYLRAFPTLAGGDVIHAACGLLNVAGPDQLAELAAQAPPGAAGLVCLPYLSPAGERAPFLDPLVPGGFLGLTVEHRREHIARAVFEGLSLVVRECLAASLADPTELRVCGGGAANEVWVQLIADVTGLPVVRSTDAEVGARGAFLVGLAATGRIAGVEDAVAQYVTTRAIVEPDSARAAFYTQIVGDVIALREGVREYGPRMASVRRRSGGFS